jgi:hypothetical protein
MFKLRLAAHLSMSMRQIERMDAVEFAHWRAAYAIEPWGTQVWDMLMARICQTIAAVVGESRTVESFMLFPDAMRHEPKEPMTFDEVSAVLGGVRDWMKHGHNGR